MKPDIPPDRRLPTIELQRQIEWIDTDAAGRYHFSTVFRLVEACETELLNRLDMGTEYEFIPRAQVTANFKKPLQFRDTVTISLWVTNVGRRSIAYDFELSHDGDIAVEGSLVGVHIDTTGQALPWSDHQRQLLNKAQP